MSSEPIKILICATQRSGSTMVCEDFANQPGLGIPNEYFTTFLQEWRTTRNLVTYSDVIANGVDELGNMSVKIMSSYLHEVDLMLGGNGYQQSLSCEAFRKQTESSQYVRLIRNEKDRQALSRLKAAASGHYHLLTKKSRLRLGNSVSNPELIERSDYFEYSEELAERLIAEIEKIKHEEKIWTDFFQLWGIEPFEIVYERAASGGANYLLPLGEKIGVSLPDSVIERSIKRLSGSSSDQIIAKFRSDFPEHAL